MIKDDNISFRFYDDHVGLQITDTTRYFVYPDSQHKFYKTKEVQGSDWYYANSADNLSYNIDRYGFRNNQLISDTTLNPYILAVGCSHTMGIANYYEEIYINQLSQMLGILAVNIGLAGSSNEISFLNILWLLKNFNKPKAIIFQKTGIDRFPIMPEPNRLHFAGSWVGNWAEEYKDLEKFMEISDRFGYNNVKQKMIEINLQHICKIMDIQLLFFDPNVEVVNFSNRDFARDLMHYGPKTHKYFADLLLARFET